MDFFMTSFYFEVPLISTFEKKKNKIDMSFKVSIIGCFYMCVFVYKR